jgi:hypothetical protein
MSNPILALIPSGYKSEKVYSILPNDGSGDFTYDRDTPTDGTRVRKDGLIEQMGNDIPRLDWLNSNCPSLLLEPQRTNRQIRSEEFDNAAWNKQADITVTANQVTAPTGELTADKIQRGSTINTNNYLSDVASKSDAKELDACTSVFVKQGEGDFFAFRITGTYPNRADAIFQFSNTTLTTSVAGSNFTVTSSKVENYGNGWYRLSVVYNTDNATIIRNSFSPRGTSGQIDSTDTSTSAFVYLWGCQVEEGASLTSYIKTEGGSGTRNADVCTDAGDADLFDITEGSFYIDITPFINDDSSRYISLSDSSSDNRIEYQLRSSANAIDVLCEGQNGGLEVQRTITISFNTRNKLLATFDDSSFKIYVNGSLDFTDTSFTKPTSLNRLSFANNSNNFAYQGKAHDVRVYDRVLTEAEAIKLTT